MRHTTFGIILVLLGVFLGLSFLVQDTPLVLRLWPLVIIVYAILAHGLSPAYRGGLMVVALVLLLDALAPSILGSGYGWFWALLLIFVGLLIIFSATERGPRKKKVEVNLSATPPETRSVKFSVREDTDEGTTEAGNASTVRGGTEMSDETKHEGLDTEGGEKAGATTVEGEYRSEGAHFFADVPAGAERLICELDFNAGRLELAGGTDRLFEIQTEPGSDVEPEVNLTLEEADGVKAVRLRIQQAHFKGSIRMLGMRTEWTLKLSDRLPLAMNCDVNAAKARLDFSQLRLTSLTMDNNAAASEVRLGAREDETDLRVDNNAAKLDLVLPADFAYEATVDSNVGKHNVTELLPRRKDDRYFSDDFASNPRKIRMRLENNAAKLNLRKQ